MSVKVILTESQFDKALYAVLSDSDILSEGEQLSKSDVEQIAKKAVKSYFESGRNIEFENKVKSVVHQMVKSDKAIETAVVEITKNVLIQLYKALWTKKTFWTSDLRNSPS